jgi:hypothetical protein
MAGTIEQGGGRHGNPWRIAGWGLAASLLLVPAVAMRFTREVDWTAFDFMFAAILIGGVGIAFEAAVRMTANIAYRAGIAVALAAIFLLVWVNGAVGMIGSENNPYNLLFIGVIVLALAGAVAARFRAAGMARAMIVAAVAQAAVGAAGISADLRGGILSTAFAGLWLLSAALFRQAARGRVGKERLEAS